MELLRGLGVDSSVGIQLVLFLVTYLILHFVLFKPYFAAYSERVSRTMGRAEEAEKYLAEAKNLQSEYEQKAQALAGQYKVIYDQARLSASKEYDRIVNAAKQTAKAQAEVAQKTIRSEMEGARSALQKEVPQVAGAITSRLLGKDLIQ